MDLNYFSIEFEIFNFIFIYSYAVYYLSKNRRTKRLNLFLNTKQTHFSILLNTKEGIACAISISSEINFRFRTVIYFSDYENNLFVTSLVYLFLGVCHSDELIYLYVIPFPSIPPGLNVSETKLSKKMLQTWTNFVKYG
jgi:hypothetical protein